MPFADFSGNQPVASSRWGSSTDPNSTVTIDKQIANANTRISDAGYTPQDTDTRNWFEKLTNLPQKQNGFLDALELIGRPGNAIKNVLDKTLIKGTENIGQALDNGIAGRDRVTGSEIAANMGIQNKPLQFAAGLGLDIATDPTTYIPGGVIAKGIGAVAKPIGGLAKGAYGLAESAIPALQTLRETRIAPALNSAKDALGHAFVPQYKWDQTLAGGTDNTLKTLFNDTNNTRDFMNENALNNIGQIAKTTGLDAGTDVGRLAEKDLRQFQDVKGYEFPNGLQRTENKGDLFAVMNQNKQNISDISKGLQSTNKEYTGAISEFSNALDQTNKQISKLYFGLERNAGKEVDSATKSNLRDAARETNRLDSQINNFGQVENSMLRDYKKQIVNEHNANFDILKEIRKVAPNGINPVGFELPSKLQSMSRLTGKGVDEVADELGYKYANDMLQDVKRLDSMPRKLSNEELTAKAAQEMERTGAKQHLADTFQSLNAARDTAKQSLSEISSGIEKGIIANAGKGFKEPVTKEEFQKMAQSDDYFIRTVRTPQKDLEGRTSTPAGKIGIDLGLSKDTHKGVSGFKLKDQARMLEWMGKEGWEHENVAVYKGKPTSGQTVLDKGEVEFNPSKLVGVVPTKLFKEHGGDFHMAASSLSVNATRTGKITDRAFADLSAHPEYNSLNSQKETLQAQRDALRNESKQAQQSGIEKIKGLQGTNEDLKQSLQNPVMIQKEIPRIQREMSTDPAVLQATKKIVDSNDNLRQWATDNDIPIGEIDGYMRHILSQEEQALRKSTGSTVDRSSGSMSNPDKKILNPRKLMGSVEDVNDQMGRNFFEPNAYFATAIGQKKLIDYGNAVKFRREILSNPDFAQPFKKGMNVADHHELIDTNNYSFMKNGENALPDQIGGKYVVTKGVKEALDRYQGLATDEGTKGMIKAFDNTQNFWKKLALFSPGFHIRNVAGAMFNNTVAGMNPIQLVKYTKEAGSEVMNAVKGYESALFTEYRSQGLSSSGISKVEFAKTGEAPEKAVIKTVENMSKSGVGKTINAVKHPFETSQKIGDAADQVNRFALYKWARETKGMSPEEAAAKVKEVQYDYRDLTPFERNVMKRAIPFYTWSRKNIPFQLKSFINDPRAYSGINKIRLNAQSTAGLNDTNTPDFMKENFAIPLSHSKMLGLNLPLADLTKLTQPLKMLTDGLSPIVKTPIEESLNYNFFKGKPIEKFAGQDKKYLGGLAIPAKLDYAIQAATGQIGKGLSTAFGDTGNVDLNNKFKTPSLGMSVVKDYNADQSIKFQKLDQLKQLQDYMSYIQQQTGAKPRTLTQIKKGSSRWD